jgi:thiol peroxidase
MARTVNFKGSPLTLTGRNIKPPAVAPDFRVTSQDMKEVTLGDFKGRIKVITSFPSLDTQVCDLQVKEFNKRAAGLSSGVVIIGISKDLPFAQKRFCESFDITNISVVSDYKTSSFGINYGLLIRELNLLARAVLILDKNNYLRYIQIAPEITRTLDYEVALSSLKQVLASPSMQASQEFPGHCTPCEGNVPPLPKEKIELLLAKYRNWELIDGAKIVKQFKFKDFVEAKYFLDLVAVIAEEQGHHPTINIVYNKVKITLTTHAANGLTDNDFIMAKIIDELV